MKSSDLNSFLNGLFSGDELKQTIQAEVSIYNELLQRKGSCILLPFNEDEKIIMHKFAIKKLLQETLFGRLSNIDLAYICDCLTMAEDVVYLDHKVEDIVFAIADPEINGGFKSDLELHQIIDNI